MPCTNKSFEEQFAFVTGAANGIAVRPRWCSRARARMSSSPTSPWAGFRKPFDW